MRIRLLAAAVVAAVSAPVHAVSLENLGLTHEQVRSLNAQLTAPATAPGLAFGSPIAFGAAFGQAYAGIGGETTPPGAPDDVDGSAFVGLGLGNANSAVGLEAAATFISLRDSFGEDGEFNAKLHRAIGKRGAIAVGAEGLGGWGAAKNKDESLFAAYTQVFDLAGDMARHPFLLSVNVGVGNERFVDPGDDGVGVFGGISLTPIRRLSVIADWTGRDLNAGLSVVPIQRLPLVITLGAVNLTERLGRDVEFAGGLGYLFQL